MSDKIKFSTAQITTENLADYLSRAMSEADGDFDCVEKVEAYLDNTIDLIGRDDFYLNVLEYNRGKNFEQQLGYDVFDTEEEIIKEAKKYDLHLLNRGYEDYLGVDDIANEENSCEMAFSTYQEKNNEDTIDTAYSNNNRRRKP
ncbi:hypothetical protein [Edwardsiella piscicida]|uniref:hypothetical protein n=1 Tax=Edwardsiella piscicida TaxID=1263550 RepID=UPI000D5249A8|nr:hypothetical protein [Edwardsiella piscicida]EKS7812714.1 hypothetical protein [Edwardsiella piscicida]UCQ20450.1 hypothetical protein DCE66_13490 [Edwardsiella piscicida]